MEVLRLLHSLRPSMTRSGALLPLKLCWVGLQAIEMLAKG
jgi:hypothetical protein